ncbi:cation diffusion facilitator family transporter [Brevibacterium antiquum]|uniref:cation diffusion facilitator family transporter n=1 Tax=Brevibacterium antiquum TaxID=234835 RepID=UPI0018E05985|nr:cation diffusion facilitator family transporter [Brevibacterium antiquum]
MNASGHHEHDRAHEVHHHEHPTGVKGVIYGLFVPHSHDASDSIDDALVASHHGIRAVKISLVILSITAVIQVAIVAISGSVALLADTIHNFADALTAIPLWIAFTLSRRPPTQRFTWGMGRVEDLAGLFIVAMIGLSAVLAGVESVRRLLEPQAIANTGWVFAAGIVGFAGNELVAIYRIRTGRRIGSAALVADGIHARTDGLTSLAVVIGVIGVWFGLAWADPAIGIVISVAIFVLLITTAKDIGQRLLDGVDPTLTASATQAILSAPEVADVTKLRLRWNGHRLDIQTSVVTTAHLTVATFHEVQAIVDARLRDELPSVGDVTVTPTSTAQNCTLFAIEDGH